MRQYVKSIEVLAGRWKVALIIPPDVVLSTPQFYMSKEDADKWMEITIKRLEELCHPSTPHGPTNK